MPGKLNKTGFTIDSPTKILLSTTKAGKMNWFQLNLNAYRNLHWSMLAKSKRLYKDIIIPFLMECDAHLLKMGMVEIEYQIIACNNRKFDTMNMVSVIDKYFQDVLSGAGIIKDDNWKIVKKITILPVIVDKELPESICRITVKEFV